MFDELRKAGARVVEFNPLNPLAALDGHSPNDRDHRKIMVVDGRIGFVGGINLARVYEIRLMPAFPPTAMTPMPIGATRQRKCTAPSSRRCSDCSSTRGRSRRAIRFSLRAIFRRSRGRVCKRFASSAACPARSARCTPLAQTAVRAAVHRAWLSSGYFVPPHQEREDLAKAARRGVDLRLVVPSHADVHDAVYAGRAAYGDLLEAGGRIYEVRNAVLHSKIAVVDGVWTAIGSSNLDRRSVVFNNEVDAIVLGTETASQVQALLERDMANSVPISLQEWQRRPFDERVHELGARLWQYWM